MVRVVLVRHGHPRVEGGGPSRWTLSAEGREAALTLSQEPVWETVECIFTSPEPKAEETARTIAEPRSIRVEIREELVEIRRPIETEDYEDKIRAFLKGEGPSGWETREEGEARLQRAMEEMSHGDTDVGLVSHGLLLTLLLARITAAEPAFSLHHSIGFAEYAVYDSEAEVLLHGFRLGDPDRDP